jgi:hypothetical protein
MSIGVVGCPCGEEKLAGQFMNKEKIRGSIKATASVFKLCGDLSLKDWQALVCKMRYTWLSVSGTVVRE